MLYDTLKADLRYYEKVYTLRIHVNSKLKLRCGTIQKFFSQNPLGLTFKLCLWIFFLNVAFKIFLMMMMMCTCVTYESTYLYALNQLMPTLFYIIRPYFIAFVKNSFFFHLTNLLHRSVIPDFFFQI